MKHLKHINEKVSVDDDTLKLMFDLATDMVYNFYHGSLNRKSCERDAVIAVDRFLEENK